MRPRSRAPKAQVAAAAGAPDRSPRASSSAASSCRIAQRSRSAISTSASTPSARPRPTCARARRRCRRRSSISATPRCARRSPGRVGKLEITVGNLVAAGPGAPVLTTLVSVNPIYASFDADEQVVTRALRTLGGRSDAVRDRAHPGADGDRHQRRHALQGPAAADRQPGRRPQRHGARARGVRQRRRQADAGPVRAAAHGPAPRPSRRCWSASAPSAPTRTRSS